MKRSIFFALLLLGLRAPCGAAQVAYLNDFSTSDSLESFTVYGESFTGYTPPPLHTVSVVQGQLQVATDAYYPNGANNNPVLFGSALLMRSNADFGAGFTNVLSKNQGLVSWSFNIANQDGAFNNAFQFILASTAQDPTSINASGYQLSGGGMVGNRMVLYRYGTGLYGNTSMVIDLTNGLGTMPAMGSYKVTFDPGSGTWSLFGVQGSQFVDPAAVTTLLGSGIDTTYTKQALPYFGVGGSTTGLDVIDNYGVSVVPEPSSLALLAAIALLGWGTAKRAR